MRAFPSLEKLGQPVFRQRELMICGKPLSGHALSHRAGLRMVWNARHEDYIGVTNRGPKVGWLGVILSSASAQLCDL